LLPVLTCNFCLYICALISRMGWLFLAEIYYFLRF
jgi:hypothetical protein